MPARSTPDTDAAPDVSACSDARAAALRKALIAWFRKHRRDLPWRVTPPATPDPYHALVSELMLQQTQVATVVPYFERFVTRFPTVHALAGAEEAEVLKLWEGLGYYRRARFLHAAARVIVAEHGGALPRSVAGLQALPGIGRYSAGSIASIAMGIPAPIVDGNVERVLARWFCIESDFGDAKARKPLWALAERLVPATRRGDPGAFNEGLMELGATVCTPRSPRCGACPVRKQCDAYAAGRVDELPVKKKRVTPRGVVHRVYVVCRRRRYLLQQRPDDGLWAGMWQFVTDEREAGDGWLGERFGLAGEAEPINTFSHQTTHKTIRFEVVRVNRPAGRLRRGAARWCTLGEAAALPMSNPQRRVLAQL